MLRAYSRIAFGMLIINTTVFVAQGKVVFVTQSKFHYYFLLEVHGEYE